MNDVNPHFEAFLFHLDFGNEMVRGSISCDHRTLFFESETIALEIPGQRLVVELGTGDDERIYLSDPARPGLKLFTTDDSILDSTPLAQFRHRREELESAAAGRGEIWRRLRVTLYFFAAFALIAWLGSFAGSLMVRSLVNEIPSQWETKFGDSVMEQLEHKMTFVNDSNAVAQLTALAAPLIHSIPAKNIKFKFHIEESAFPNAFAVPGGHIVVTTGLLKTADTPDELLGVIAHEAAHITQKHAFRHLISGKGPIFILQIFMGSRNRMLDALAYPSEALVYESFSQQYEKEADAVGWNYLVAAKINPHGMIDIFRKLKTFETSAEPSRKASAFDSHPAMDKRIEWLEEKWNKLPDKTDFIELTNPVPKIGAKMVDTNFTN
ncbi:MAG: M48 family metallopeptidase [Limisphaerales bacterium]